jgi:preprotein translocase subunit SecA
MLADWWRDAWQRALAFVRRWAAFYRADLRQPASKSSLEAIRRRRDEFEKLLMDELAGVTPNDRIDVFAKAAVASERILGLRPHDVQIQGALAMSDGKIAEMQTGEGKTLAAVMAVAWHAHSGDQVHVLTANDYLAQRDATWMGDIYRFLGHSVGFIAQSMSSDDRRRAYECDIVYATANEVGFDFLRDQLARSPEELVLPDFGVALVDEADSILIDEARIPLVIAGGVVEAESLARRMAEIAATFHRGRDFTIDEHQRNVRLTDRGIKFVERAFQCPNLFAEGSTETLASIEAALHARALLHRDIDYIVRNGAIELVDEFKGRVAENRRWPAGLQTALEAKEGLELRSQGRILGSITLQNLLNLYPKRCGMTGTAATESAEFRAAYGLEVIQIKTHRPIIRTDAVDHVFTAKHRKITGVVTAISQMHALGRPVLVGTASVAESEELSALVTASGIPNQVLNARQDAEEAAIIARAGERSAVTISTNMAGRGTDIVLGEGVAELGGLHVIGTNRHESRRIDHQLRGRAGRQGDPGSSQFLVSLQDDLLIRFGIANWNPDSDGIATVQRVIEGQHFETRQTLRKYDGLIEYHRKLVQARRREMLFANTDPALLAAIDLLWSDYLAWIAELREGIHWRSWGGREPFQEYLADATKMFDEVLARLERIATGEESPEATAIGATWTYMINDQPFGSMQERMIKAAQRILSQMGLRRGSHRN